MFLLQPYLHTLEAQYSYVTVVFYILAIYCTVIAPVYIVHTIDASFIHYMLYLPWTVRVFCLFFCLFVVVFLFCFFFLFCFVLFCFVLFCFCCLSRKHVCVMYTPLDPTFICIYIIKNGVCRGSNVYPQSMF